MRKKKNLKPNGKKSEMHFTHRDACEFRFSFLEPAREFVDIVESFRVSD